MISTCTCVTYIDYEHEISKLNIPRPILKVKEKQTTEELAGMAAQRKTMIRSNRKSSLGGDNSGGDRRRSRIYSIGGNGIPFPITFSITAEIAVMEEAIGEVVDTTLVDDMVTEPVEIEEVCKVAEEEVVLLTDVAANKPHSGPLKPRNSIFKAKQKKAAENCVEGGVTDPDPVANKDKNMQGIIFFFIY